MSNPKFQGDSNEILLLGCSKCNARNEGEFLVVSNIFFGCSELDHKINLCPKVSWNEEGGCVDPNPILPPVLLVLMIRKNSFKSLQSRGEQVFAPNVTHDMCFMLISILVVFVFYDLINWT